MFAGEKTTKAGAFDGGIIGDRGEVGGVGKRVEGVDQSTGHAIRPKPPGRSVLLDCSEVRAEWAEGRTLLITLEREVVKKKRDEEEAWGSWRGKHEVFW